MRATALAQKPRRRAHDGGYDPRLEAHRWLRGVLGTSRGADDGLRRWAQRLVLITPQNKFQAMIQPVFLSIYLST